MFLRETKRKNMNGSTVSYLQLAVSEWDKQRKRPVSRIVYSFGRTDEPMVIERLRRLAHGLQNRCFLDELVADRPDWQVVDAWPHGPVYVLEALWQRLGRCVFVGGAGTVSADNLERLALGGGKYITCMPIVRGSEVEQAWRTLKSSLKLRPVNHWAPHRVHAHVSLTVLELLLERVSEVGCGDTWRNIRDDLGQIKLAQLSGPDGELWQVTSPKRSAANRLKSLKIPNPPEILDHA